MKGEVNELERAEAYGDNGQVQVREGNRLATGSHLTYTAADDQYLMVGTPVEVIEAKDGVCRLTRGQTATFNRATEQASIKGTPTGNVQGDMETLKACPAGFIR
jgi:lipopolysaccharide export system protein LptA